MRTSNLELGLLQLTVLLVFLTTLALVWNLSGFRNPPSHITSAQRLPASVNWEENSQVQISPPEELSVKKLSCKASSKPQNFKSQANRLRLMGSFCFPVDDIRKSWIVNKTNGFEATIFPLESNDFTTDFINLEPGENHIHISHKLKSGKRVFSELFITY